MIKNSFTEVKTAKGRKISSTNWLRRQLNDPYIKRAERDKYRSRSAYKLIDINTKFLLLKSHYTILDVGAAPGGWSQVAAKYCKKVIAVDIVEMLPISNVDFIQCDFVTSNSLIQKHLSSEKIDTILSDMSPTTCGHAKTDHIRIILLCEELISFAKNTLKTGGNLVTKIFHGANTQELYANIKKLFKQVKYYKPPSSRKESNEIYLVATNFLQ